jgi:hypothetical protein
MMRGVDDVEDAVGGVEDVVSGVEDAELATLWLITTVLVTIWPISRQFADTWHFQPVANHKQPQGYHAVSVFRRLVLPSIARYWLSSRSRNSVTTFYPLVYKR